MHNTSDHKTVEEIIKSVVSSPAYPLEFYPLSVGHDGKGNIEVADYAGYFPVSAPTLLEAIVKRFPDCFCDEDE